MADLHRIYTLWASVKDEAAPWMIAAEDEYAWEGNPERCAAIFKVARANAEHSDFDVREVTLLIDYGAVMRAFEPVETEVSVRAAGEEDT